MVLTVLLLSAAAAATVIVPAEFREVVQGSELIALARVVDVQPVWADGRKRIDSVVTAEVVTWLKGGGTEAVTFQVPGGELGRYRSVMVGAPVFRAGDEAFLFLKTRGAPRPYVFGLNQGVYRVRTDGRTGQRVVIPPALLAAGDSPQIVRRGAAARVPIGVEAFGAQVHAVLSEGGGR